MSLNAEIHALGGDNLIYLGASKGIPSHLEPSPYQH